MTVGNIMIDGGTMRKRKHLIVGAALYVLLFSWTGITQAQTKTGAAPSKSSKELKSPSKQPGDSGSKSTPPEKNAQSSYDVTFKFDYQAPLSVSDAVRLSYNLIALLNPGDDKFVNTRREKAAEAIQVIIDYIRLVDDRHSSLPYYRWYLIDERRVTPGGIDEDKFKVERILEKASAVSFVAFKGDVFVHNIKVVDNKEKEVNFKINRWVRVGLPRKEVCFLYFPMNISMVVVNYSAEETIEGPPDMQVYGGVTTLPEHGKVSLYYLTRARQNLIQNGKFENSIKDLREAITNLIRFKNSRRI
jgi:hypothetical protein